MTELFVRYTSSPGQLRSCIDDIHVPAPLTDQYQKQDKKDAVEGYLARFN